MGSTEGASFIVAEDVFQPAAVAAQGALGSEGVIEAANFRTAGGRRAAGEEVGGWSRRRLGAAPRVRAVGPEGLHPVGWKWSDRVRWMQPSALVLCCLRVGPAPVHHRSFGKKRKPGSEEKLPGPELSEEGDQDPRAPGTASQWPS